MQHLIKILIIPAVMLWGVFLGEILVRISHLQ